jgi:hypothetical protein
MLCRIEAQHEMRISDMNLSSKHILKDRLLPLLVVGAFILLALAPGDRVEQRIEAANEKFEGFCEQVDTAIRGADPELPTQAIVLERPLGKAAGIAVCSGANE